MTRQTKRLAIVALMGLAGLTAARLLPWQELAAPWVEADSLIARAFAQGNLPPIADAGRDRTVAVDDTVVLDGSGSTDPKGMVDDFAWQLIQVPAGSVAALDDPTAVKPSFIADLAGDYVIELVLTEGNRQSAPDTVTVSTNNSTPVADAGPDQAVALADMAQLDGSRSSDDDGDALTYAWTLVQKPVGSSAGLSNANVVRPEFLVDLAGTFIAELTVDDGTGPSAPDLVVVSTEGVAPRAAAGLDVTSAVGPKIQFDGSVSIEPDGEELAYDWALISVPFLSAEELASPQDPRPTLVVDKDGLYLLQLTIDDDSGEISRDTLVISTLNSAPVAGAGPDQTVAVGDLVTLDGRTSADLDGDIITLRWALISKPLTSTTAALDDPTALRPTFEADVAGDYVVQLIVDDGTESSAPDSVVITTTNSRPVAEAGPVQTVAINQLVQLDASASADADGETLTFQWSILEEPNGSNDSFSDATSATPSIAFGKFGDHVVQVAVSDGERVDHDTVVITMIDSRPLAVATADAQVLRDVPVQLDGSASSDVDGNPLAFFWALIVKPDGSTATIDDPAAASPSFTPDEPGDYLAQLIVSEASVANPLATPKMSLPASALVRGNHQPVAVASADNSNPLVGTLVTLDGSASSDDDDDPLTFLWTITQQPAGGTAVLSDPVAESPSFTPDAVGAFVIELVVNDGFEDSEPVQITVTAFNTQPVANAGADQNVTAGDMVQLDGSGSSDPDPGQSIVSFTWSLAAPAGSGASLSSTTAVNPTFTADVAGSYTATLVVNDGFEDSAPDTVTVTAISAGPNERPIAEAGPEQGVVAGALVQLDGSASFDPEGQLLSFTWRFTAFPGATAPVLNNATIATPTFTASLTGLYIAELTVNDGTQDSLVPDTVGIQASTATPNNPPTIAIVPDPVVTPPTVALGNSLSLTLTGSDPDLDPLAFFAASLPLPAGAVLDGASGAFSFTPDASQVGDIVVTLGVTDGLGSDSESVTITVLGAQPGGVTAFTAQVLDASDGTTPVEGATVALVGDTISATTDANGDFTLSAIPSGSQVLEIDGSTVPVTAYASAREDLSLIADVTNVAPAPFFLAPIDPTGATAVVAGQTTTVSNTNLDVSLVVQPDAALNPDGTLFAGTLSISNLPPALAGSLLPPFVSPCQIVTVQPAELTFVPQALITLPNLDNLPVGTEVDIWALDPRIGLFRAVGVGRVDAANDIVTVSGGLPWGGPVFAVPLAPVVAAAVDYNGFNRTPTALADGNLFTSFSTPSYRTLGVERSRTLVYNSDAAAPSPIIGAEVTVPARSSLPPLVESRLEVGGVTVAGPVFTSTTVADDPADPGLAGGEAIRQALQFDAGALPSGSHGYRFVASAAYACSKVGGTAAGQVIVDNQSDSPFGAGWSLQELQALTLQPDGRAVIREGDGTTLVFDPQPDGTIFETPLSIPANVPLQSDVADYDGNGALDLAVADSGDGTVLVLLNDGAGGFRRAADLQSGTPVPVPDRTQLFVPDTYDVASGDFNGDGILDLAAANQGLTGQAGDGVVKVYLGQGGGAFEESAVVDPVLKTGSLAVADFNGDGFDDFVTTSGGASIGYSVIVYFSDGLGGFPTSTAPVSVGTGAESIVIADMNNDGAIDFVIPGFARVRWFLNDGAGNFTQGPLPIISSTLQRGFVTRYMDGGDLNGDDFPDIVIATRTVRASDGTIIALGRVLVLLNDQGTGFLPRIALDHGIGEDSTLSVKIADMDQDGALDILATGQDSPVFSVLLGDGAGNFAPSVVVSLPAGTGGGISELAVADFTGDGAPDVFVPSIGLASMLFLPADTSQPLAFLPPRGDFSSLVKNAGPPVTFTRRLKDGTEIVFDAEGQHIETIDRNDNATSYAYNPDGTLDSVSDPLGLSTSVAYQDGNIVSFTDPDGRVTQFQIGADGELTQIVQPDDTARRYAYDENNRLIAEASERGFVTTNSYGSAGQWTGSGLPDGSSIALQISQDLGLAGIGLGTEGDPAPFGRPENGIAELTDDRGNTTFVKVNEFGAPIEIIDAIGQVTTLTRNEDNLVAQTVAESDDELPDGTVPGAVVTDFDYDERGNVTARREAAGTTLERQTGFEYEPVFNRATKITDPSNTAPTPACGTAGVTCFTYNAKGNLEKVTAFVDGQAFDSQVSTYRADGLEETRQDANGNLTQFDYDISGNLEIITDAELNQAKFLRDSVGRVEQRVEGFGSLEERTTSFTYDAMNRIETETDGVGSMTARVYNSSGNLVQLIDESNRLISTDHDEIERPITVVDSVFGTNMVEYDLAGNIRKISDTLGVLVEYEIDPVNRVMSGLNRAGDTRSLGVSQQSRLTSYAINGQEAFRFRYDLLGRIIGRSNANGQAWTFQFDSRDNMIKEIDPKLQEVLREYDEFSRLKSIVTSDNEIRFEYDNIGNMLVAMDNDSMLSFSYDKLNRLISVEDPLDGIRAAIVLTFEYDSVGNRKEILDSDGGQWLMAYDETGLLTQATGSLGASVDLTYLSSRLLESRVYSNQIRSDISYDPDDGRIASIVDSLGAVQVQSFEYQHNTEGFVTSITEQGGARVFTYDELLRISGAGFAASPENYTYDAEGNRITSHISSEHITDAANRLLEDDSFCYSYDANGNLEQKTEKVLGDCVGSETRYIYDVQNQLVQIDLPGNFSVSYRYDALGRRIAKISGGTVSRYVYDEQNIILEYDETGALEARYVHGDRVDQPLIMERNQASYFFHSDSLGSIRKLTDEFGFVVNSYDYESYGLDENRVETVPNPYGFTAREFDPESGLYYYRARYYDPSSGRFLSEDPIGLAAFDGNLYRYVFNNPVNVNDPSGTEALLSYFPLPVIWKIRAIACFVPAIGIISGGGAVASNFAVLVVIAGTLANAVDGPTPPNPIGPAGSSLAAAAGAAGIACVAGFIWPGAVELAAAYRGAVGVGAVTGFFGLLE